MTDSRARIDAHLTEEERHGLADGSLIDERRSDADAHAATCAECAADVARLRSLMMRLEQLPNVPHSDLDALWPAIRGRIEQGKLVSLETSPPVRRSIRRRWWVWVSAGTAAAAMVLAFALHRTGQPPIADVVTVQPGSTQMVSVADSSSAYREQVEALLEDLELRRAMLQPATAASITRDLHIIDDAIAELNAALARDPDNPALRQLLAASYRQKRDLLRQADNAS